MAIFAALAWLLSFADGMLACVGCHWQGWLLLALLCMARQTVSGTRLSELDFVRL